VAEPATPEDLYRKREAFFKLAFGVGAEGYICISYMHIDGGSKRWEDAFFKYPEELPNLLHSIARNYKTSNVYFCPQLFANNIRQPGWKSACHKENVLICPTAWADLDGCSPDLLLVQPTVSLETSDGRYHALWLFADPQPPEVAEQISKNIAYHHVHDGADAGGWDLTQRLRVPYTYNLKRQLPFEVRIDHIDKSVYAPEDFSDYKESRINRASHDPMPEVLPPEASLDLLQRYRRSLNPIVFSLHSVQPMITSEEGGWSKPLWQMLMLCFEAGMSREEVFAVASDAACNKYRRDNKNPRFLWEDVCRAYASTVEKLNILVPETEKIQPLITDAELALIEGHETFVERYIKWACSLGDAASAYHQAGAFMVLSGLLAGSVRLPTSFGTIMPNLWFMLLGDTTLTRKTTAMDTAMSVVEEVDSDVLLATDGSLEGMMQALEIRPAKPSIFKRDEVSGLIEAMARKDYMAGMAEALTQLYDGKTLKRVLKRETVTVREPCLLFFAGGIKTRVQSLLTLEHVASGFIPRFVFLTAESDISKLRPLGPPTMQNLEERAGLIEEAREIRERYVFTQEVILKGKLVDVSESRTMASLAEETWVRYNQLEATLLYAGINHEQPDIMTPVYDRLAKSILKAAVLIAASRCKGELVVEVEDLLQAIKYGDGWRKYATEIVNGIGRSANEILLQRIFMTIRRHPGVARSQLMRWYHLEARQAEIMFATMEQRGLITATRLGRTWIYEAVGRIKVQDAEAKGNSDR
jgi:hypothetical protein